MEHSIALVTGATSVPGDAAASMFAAEGYREVIDTWSWTRQPAFSPFPKYEHAKKEKE